MRVKGISQLRLNQDTMEIRLTQLGTAGGQLIPVNGAFWFGSVWASPGRLLGEPMVRVQDGSTKWVLVLGQGVAKLPELHRPSDVRHRPRPGRPGSGLTLALPVDLERGRPWVSASTQDVRGCPSAHTGRPWLSVCVRQHTHDVCGCPSVHISAPWSLDLARWSLDSACWPFPWTVRVILAYVGCLFSTHRTSVGVHQYTYQHVSPWTQHADPSLHTGRPWVSASTRRTSVAVRVCLSVPVSTHMTSVAVHQYTYQNVGPWTQHAGPSRGLFGCPPAQTGCLWLSVSTHRTSVAVRVCPSAHTGRLWLSVCVCVCPSAHTGRLWLSISTHISALVLGLSTLALPGDCSGDFGPRGLSVQYTQEIHGCPPAHTGCLWLSVSTHRTSVAVRVCPSAHIGRPWVSVSTHRTSVCVRQHIQDVRGCPCVSVSTHRTSLAVHQYTYQHVGPWNQHAYAPPTEWAVRCVRGVSVQHTQDVVACPYPHLVQDQHVTLPLDSSGDFVPRAACRSVHTGRPWVSVSTIRGRHGFVCVVSTHRTSVAVPSLPYQHPYTQDVRCGVSQHTQDVCGCPSAHTGHLWLSVCVRVCTSAHIARLWLSISLHISTLVLGISTHTLPVDCSADFGPRGLTVQYTHDIRGCPTHISTLVLGLSALALPVDCSGDFGPCGLSVQYTQDVRGCPSAHTGRPVGVRQHTQDVSGCPVCPCVSVSTHRASVAVHQYTYQHVGPWNQHAYASRGLFG
ncbi:hypothetical protein IGI04_042338 [Brassica rapa subsp. trilocularis]|uniref:Uncharacterized protein n=1 Tax=Brassica rapa subsp. trilocularis TaxID=1813537 RepID=A0ABQ7KJN0_BRACM|nr:hypothetical protein IGI04_042338 [Brassica rapa subsp. trilocularis]